MPTGREHRRLGKGLAELIQPTAVPVATPGVETPMTAADVASPRLAVRLVRCDAIRPNPLQPRTDIPEQGLAELTESIRKTGLIQPVLLRAVGSRYELIAGERRWRAAQRAGLAEIPAIVRSASDEEMLELALVENIFREDLNAMQRARAYRRYCDEFGLTAEQVAGRLGEDRSTVANYLRLLELPESVQEMVEDGRLSMGHARALAGLDDRGQVERIANLVVTNFFSVRALEELVRKAKTTPAHGRPPVAAPAKRPHIRDVEEQFMRALGVKVEIIEGRRKGSGRIIIRYGSLDDFDRIAERVGVRIRDE